MKNNFILLVSSFLLSVSFTFLTVCTAQAAGDVAVIAMVKGDVDTRADGSSSWKTAKAGSSIDEGAQVKTGKSGETIIKWKQGHMLKVYPLTVISLDKLSLERRGKKETTAISIESGKALTRAEKLASAESSFQIRTPTAVAGVRGTSFMIEVSEDTSCRISLLEGNLDISGDQVDLILEESTQVEISQYVDEEPKVDDISDDVADEIQDGLEEFDSIDSVSTSAAPKSRSPEPKSADPSIKASDLIREDDFVDDMFNETIDDALFYPEEIDIQIEDMGDGEPFVPPMPPH